MGSLSESEYDLGTGKASASAQTPSHQATLARYTYCTNRRIFLGSMMIIVSAALIAIIIIATSRHVHRESPPFLRAGGTIILD